MSGGGLGVLTHRLRRPAFALLVTLVLCPALLVPIPAMVDYPNHLARMYVLSRSGTAAAHPIYHVAWALYPNLAMDVVVPWLARLTGVEVATRVFLAASQVLIVGGATALELVVKRRLQLAPAAAGLFLYSLPFAWGFLNFEFALGLALFGVAGWVLYQDRPWPLRLGVHTACTALLFVAHLFALGLYGFTLGVLECHRVWDRRASAGETSTRLALLALPAAALLGVTARAGGAVGQAGTTWLLALKPGWVFAVANGYSLTLSCGIAFVLLLLGRALAQHGALRLTRPGAWVGVAFAVLYVLTPGRLLDTSFVDVRVLVAAAFVLPAFLSVEWPSARWRIGSWLLIGVLAVANVAVVTTVWIAYKGEYATIIRSFQHVRRGARVLVGHSGAGDDPPIHDLAEYPMYHAPVLAVQYADAFVPDLFIQPGKQPVTLDSSYRRLYIPYGGPVPSALLKAIAVGRARSNVPSYIRSWYRDYDYLYVVGPRAPNPVPGVLNEIDAGSRFVLYRVHRKANR